MNTATTHIKICGLKQPDMAYAAACAGANFIGLIFVPSSNRAISAQAALAIADAARAGGAIPVAVFTQASANSMLTICHSAHIDWVQLHGDYAREQQHLLPEHFHRIYVQTVSAQGVINPDHGVNQLMPNRDYLLFDGMQAGSGQRFNWQNFSYAGDLPWFLSAGLTPDNVAAAITQLRPSGVDISSGVENASGEKDLRLIKKFIHAVQSKEVG